MRMGIDVSSHDGALDWSALKKAGVQFAILRAGYGLRHQDICFRENLTDALAQNIPVGVYWFSYALNPSQAKTEAVACLAAIGGATLTLPVFYDFEYDTVRYAAENGVALSRAEYNSFAKAFLEEIRDAGYQPGIYYNPDYLLTFVDDTLVAQEGWARWLAHYVKTTSYAYDLWQQSPDGVFPGIKGSFDLDYMRDGIWESPSVKLDVSVLTYEGRRLQPEEQVKTIQRLLKALGYKDSGGKVLAIDGSYGGATRYAVSRFQKARGLTQDGICGEQTWEALLGASKYR